jgi:hypothetical protein
MMAPVLGMAHLASHLRAIVSAWLLALSMVFGSSLGVGSAEAQPATAPAAQPAAEPADPPATAPASDADERRAEVLAAAKRLFRKGNELRKAGSCERALEFFARSRALVPSVPNILNAAVCLNELGRHDEALEHYEDLLTELKEELTAEEREAIAPAMAVLRAKLGSVDVSANVEGATLLIASRARGKLPLFSAVPVLPGRHELRVIKEGYEAYETTVTVQVGATTRVVAKLQPLSVAGRLRIDDGALAGAEVLVDGAPVGTVPWEGTLAPGSHFYSLRRGDTGTAPTAVMIVKGQTALVTAVLAPLGPEMRITLEPVGASLVIDDVPVGRGSWAGRLPLGRHLLGASDEGYFSESQAISVTPERPRSVAIKLRVDEDHARWGVVQGMPWLEIFGGFAIAPSYRGAVDDGCDGSGCLSNPLGLGLLVGARGGYEFPFRLSIELALGYLRSQKSVERVERPVAEGPGATATWSLAEEVLHSGVLATAGLRYRQPFTEHVELLAHIMAGPFFTFGRYDVSGSLAADNGTSAEVLPASSNTVSANLVVIPEVQLGLRFDSFTAGLGLTVAVFTLPGPENGTTAVSPGACSSNNEADAACQRGQPFPAGRTHRAFATFVPSLAAGYSF